MKNYRSIKNSERAFAILAYPLFTNKELCEYNNKSNIWWSNIGQWYSLKKENRQPNKKDDYHRNFAILAYPYYSNKYLSKYLKCSKTWLEKLAQKYNLKRQVDIIPAD